MPNCPSRRHSLRMSSAHRFLSCLSIAAASLFIMSWAGGCKTTAPDEKPKTTADAAATTKKRTPPPPTIPDQSADVAFQSFLGRLRKAVAAHDLPAVAELMTADFGYLLEPTATDSGSGQGVFAYWDQNNVWPELELLLRDRFVPYANFMVAPPEFAAQEGNYHGYRAGIQLVNGAWKFAYFVKG